MARTTSILALCGLFAVVAAGSAQDEPQAQAATPTTLLPVYAVDLRIDASTVDGTGYPSSSTAHPHAGTSAVFQRVWEGLQPSGFNAIRFPVDLSQGQAAVHRVANLCAWADQQGVSLLPVLVSAEKAPFAEDYATAAASFVGTLVATLGAAGPESLATYPRILMFELGEELDHPGRNGRLAPEAAAQRVVAAAAAIRAAEQTALEGSGLYLTPLLAVASVDAELVAAGAPAGAELGEAAFAQAYAGLKGALAAVAASPDVETLGVSWYPGSVGAGGVERLGPLVQSLAGDFAGKQLLVMTGFSTAFQPAEEQERFATLAFTNLADVRAQAGTASPLLGVVFHKGLGMAGPGSTPPAGFEQARQAWQPAGMASDLLALWRGAAASPAIAWWDAEVESRMGLLAVAAGAGGGGTLTAQAALQALESIAGIVGSTPVEEGLIENAGGTEAGTPEEHAEAGVPSGETGEAKPPGMLEEKLTGFVSSLLDQVLARMGDELSQKISGQGSGTGESGYPESGSGESGPGDQGTGSSAAAQVAIQGASCTPANSKVNDEVSCQVTLRNESPDAAAGDLIVALLDDEDYLLGDETMIEGVSVAPLAQESVAVPWRPAAAGTQSVHAKVYDPAGEIAAASAGQVNVAQGGASPPTEPGSEPGSPPGSPPGNQPGTTPPGGIRPGTIKPGTFVTPVKPSRFTDLLSGKASSAVLKPARPGFPLIGALASTTMSTTGGAGAVSLPLANSSTRSITGLAATLQVDGKQAQQLPVTTLLPGQSRTLVFRQLKLAPGPHELRVVLVRPGAAPLVAGALRLGAAKPTRQVRAVPGTSAGSRPASRVKLAVRPPLDAARVASTPGAVARTAAKPGAVVVARRSTTPATRRQTTSTMPGTRTTGTTTTSRGTTTTTTGPVRRSLPPPPPPRPDLAIGAGGLRVSPQSAAPGRPVSVQVVVVNVGGGDCAGAMVSFQVRGSRGETAARGGQRLGPVPARGRATASWGFTMPPAGSWRVEVAVQAANDANPGNNGVAAPITSTALRSPVRIRPPARVRPPSH